ncbi:Argonaute complex, subunit Arb1 [Dactylonectria estremocensis]|uniref:Argonaute complex, subunit Arb1 n=1 Tax=Dactylonectria estremocensis TaxID=1079267 RepID=A0A9P9JFJ7_9HYPO|nr:Argonaute complex, subunit Arb1 [Dactylonectria estremocensis]
MATSVDGIDGSVDDRQGNRHPHPLPSSLQGIVKPKKSRSGHKSLASRGPTALPKNRGNGFEEYFADPPMTPDEAEEEKSEIYASRMQSCIQRFRSRRRLQADRTLFFSEYLFLGGVDTNPSAFCGLHRQDLRDLTPAQRREVTATDVIYGTTSAGDRFYNGDADAWTVDFAGVAAGFFSVTLPYLTSFELPRMIQGIDVVDNFLRYVLQHDVCPEYGDDVKAALGVCEGARTEWPLLQKLYASLPGQFNLAAGELFRPDDAASSWSFQHFKRPCGFDAKSVFYSAFALMDEPEMFARLLEEQPEVVREFSCTVELVEIFRPDESIVKRVKSLVIGDNAVEHLAVGKATFKPSSIEDDWVTPDSPWPVLEATLTLYFDDDLLSYMPTGMKARLTIFELNVGLRFVKTVEIIVPSFYTYLPQELMRHYKVPELSDRPAPSVEDPDAEEKQHAIAAREG